MRKIAITDIHGCAKTFQQLLEKKVELTQKDQLILLGDYIDRGPDSKGVLDLIFGLKDKGIQVTCLRGNHEEMLIKGLTDKRWEDNWRQFGGKETLESFGVTELTEIPKKYIKFLKGLAHFHEVDQYIFVHAGLGFKGVDPLIDFNSMLWARNWYRNLDIKWLKGRKVVHGHTPTDIVEIERAWSKLNSFPVLNIDAGCYKKYIATKGHLCAYDLSRDVLYFQRNVDEM